MKKTDIVVGDEIIWHGNPKYTEREEAKAKLKWKSKNEISKNSSEEINHLIWIDELLENPTGLYYLLQQIEAKHLEIISVTTAHITVRAKGYIITALRKRIIF